MLRFIFFRKILKKRKWSWRNACVWLSLTFPKITKGCLSQDFFRKFKLRSVLLIGNRFTLKSFKADRRSKNQPLAVIQSRIKCKSDLNSMKTQNIHTKVLRDVSSKIKLWRTTYGLWWTEKIFGMQKKKKPEMSWISFAHFASSSRACTTRTRSLQCHLQWTVHRGKLSVAVGNERATSFKGNKIFITLGNGTRPPC